VKNYALRRNFEKMSGIYIHIPFCKKACSYCDFYFSTSFNTKEALINTLINEIKLRHNYLAANKLKSIYFGGGTPSLLSQNELLLIFDALANNFSWDKTAEITLEANPDDITLENLRVWRKIGINRLSIGLQSFNNDELIWMNRAHNAQESIDSVKMAQDEGFYNISIDLIYGSKFQTEKTWEETLRTAIDLNTQHISAYNLTIEPKTVLGLKNKKGNEPDISDDLSSKQFLMLVDILQSNNFIQYEISNFGKENFFAVHNSNYWKQEHYLGLGPSAHSFNGSSRQWNVKNNSAYIKAIENGTTFFELEELSTIDKYNEYILTRLRTIWGCNISEIKNSFGEKMLCHFLSKVNAEKEFLIENNGNYTLNFNGKLNADGITSDLFF
jgi:oxygen-independent coproporphyrinogen-3 oxidase